mmetsp:Transcript_48011/g.104516  ORF Transcript_48011/g.104516 Transcript_48011/m.104516 type:complete len:210 (+) Transcript_48011:3041-3670(+)
MVSPRQPQCVVTLGSVEPRQYILEAGKHGMAHVEPARHIRRRHRKDIRLTAVWPSKDTLRNLRLEKTGVFPPSVQVFLNAGEVIPWRHLPCGDASRARLGLRGSRCHALHAPAQPKLASVGSPPSHRSCHGQHGHRRRHTPRLSSSTPRPELDRLWSPSGKQPLASLSCWGHQLRAAALRNQLRKGQIPAAGSCHNHCNEVATMTLVRR